VVPTVPLAGATVAVKDSLVPVVGAAGVATSVVTEVRFDTVRVTAGELELL